MKKLTTILILILFEISVSYAREWKRFPVSSKNPIFKVNTTFIESRECYGACCNEDYESECIVSGSPNQHIFLTLDLSHDLARNNSPYQVEIIFYDRNDFKLEHRYVDAWENGGYSFNGWWTKRGYEVKGSVVRYAMVRIVPEHSYHIRPRFSEIGGSRVYCKSGFTWKEEKCVRKPKCKGSGHYSENWFRYDDKERYNGVLNTCISLPPNSKWVKGNTSSLDSITAFIPCDKPLLSHWTGNDCSWKCDEGLIRDYHNGKSICRPIHLPKHAHWIDRSESKWECDSDYRLRYVGSWNTDGDFYYSCTRR